MIKFTPKYFLLFIGAVLIIASCQKDYNKVDETTSGYYGTRSQVNVRAIVLERFPQLNPSSETWDSISPYDSLILAPDIFYNIIDDVADTLVYSDFFQPSQFENVTQDSLPLVYYITDEFKIPEFGRNMLFSIYDFDKADSTAEFDSTFMTSFNFNITPGDTLLNNNPYPDSLVLDNGDYRVMLYLNWKK